MIMARPQLMQHSEKRAVHMLKITAKAPTRIDLAGGTIDLWPIHQLLDQKATVNVGITLDAQVDLVQSNNRTFQVESNDLGIKTSGDWHQICQNQPLPLVGLLLKAMWREDLPALKITTSAKSPAGAGLGGSSCLAVTLCGALDAARRTLEGGPRPSDHELVQICSDVEARLIHAPTGIQDYWGALRGQINLLHFPPGGVKVTTISPDRIKALDNELIVCYSGKSRASAINNWEIFKRVFDGDKGLIAILNEIGEAAERCSDALKEGNLSRALLVSSLEWQLRVKLWPNIETPETKKLDIAAKKAGASFTRVCGAGGGGVMAVFAPQEAREKVKKALTENGGAILNARVADDGLQISH
jgi:D-glycero-alpha-D-manno-heptose-7-phosphate kinase